MSYVLNDLLRQLGQEFLQLGVDVSRIGPMLQVIDGPLVEILFDPSKSLGNMLEALVCLFDRVLEALGSVERPAVRLALLTMGSFEGVLTNSLSRGSIIPNPLEPCPPGYAYIPPEIRRIPGKCVRSIF